MSTNDHLDPPAWYIVGVIAIVVTLAVVHFGFGI
jgi:hypothetical protein